MVGCPAPVHLDKVKAGGPSLELSRASIGEFETGHALPLSPTPQPAAMLAFVQDVL